MYDQLWQKQGGAKKKTLRNLKFAFIDADSVIFCLVGPDPTDKIAPQLSTEVRFLSFYLLGPDPTNKTSIIPPSKLVW